MGASSPASTHSTPTVTSAAGIDRAADDPRVRPRRHAALRARATAAPRRRPDPFLEFCLGWSPATRSTRRDARHRGRLGLGQLHHEHGRLVAVLDVELGHVGDPMMDLAGFRIATPCSTSATCDRLYASSEARWRADRPARDAAPPLRVHAGRTSSRSTPRSPSRRRATDYMTNMQWCERDESLRGRGARRDPRHRAEPDPVDVPEPRAAGGGGARAPRGCAAQARPRPTSSSVPAAHRVRLARHLQRFDEIGDACSDRGPRRPARAPRPAAVDVAGGRRRGRGVRARRRRRPRRGAGASSSTGGCGVRYQLLGSCGLGDGPPPPGPAVHPLNHPNRMSAAVAAVRIVAP